MSNPNDVAAARRIPSLVGVDHVAWNVPDMRQAVEFFTTALGCTVLHSEPPHPFSVDPGTTVETALLRFDDSLRFELLTFSGPGIATAPSGMTAGAGYHLALAVTDLDAALACLRAIPGVNAREASLLDGKRRRAFFSTPWGMPMQLIEPGERG
jgi:catechol 2,3-dioxygenase-like lactoylglutathione lyase family enzyme